MGRRPDLGVSEFLGMGVAAAICVAGGLGVGYWLDDTLRTGPVLTLAGLGLGVVAAVTATWVQIKKYL